MKKYSLLHLFPFLILTARALELKKQEDYKLVQMLWNMKKEMAHEKFSMDWAPSCKPVFFNLFQVAEPLKNFLSFGGT